MNACRIKYFKSTDFLGYIHQAIYRQVQRSSLASEYLHSNKIWRKIRQLMAVGFVEVARIRSTFLQLKHVAPNILLPLFAYFEQQWLGSVPLAMWNVHEVDIRTNNNCEGWHNRFNRAVDRHHPNIWHLLRTINDKQASMEVLRSQIAAGQTVMREGSKYRTMKKNIDNLRFRYIEGSIDVISFLDGISYNIKA